jgi:hypothetical protein
VNAKPATAAAKMDADPMSIVVVVVMVMLSADKSCWPDCRQGNRHDSKLFGHRVAPLHGSSLTRSFDVKNPLQNPFAGR